MKNKSIKKGFTLLELLIVITIIAILSVILVLVLNPAEILKKSRDVQRMSDLSTLKTAIAIYTTEDTTPYLDGGTDLTCIGNAGGADSVWVSVASDDANVITDVNVNTTVALALPVDVTTAALSGVGGSGWIPVNLTSIVGGSPISNLPVDPVNNPVHAAIGTSTASTSAAITNSALMYRYSCNTSAQFEIDATLESAAYGPGGVDDKSAKDGGNNVNLFEIGTGLTTLSSGDDV